MSRFLLMFLLLVCVGCACSSLHESLHGVFPFCAGGDPKETPFFFILLWLAITAAFFWAGLTIWGWLWLAILLCVAIAEIVSKVRTGRTITQQFKAWAALHRWQAILLLLGMAGVWALLLLHLIL